MFVKVCGLKREEEIDWAVELGYTAIGIVLHPESKRFTGKEKAVKLADYAGERIIKVAVAKRYADLQDVSPFFDFIQVYQEVESDKLIYAGDRLPGKRNFTYFLYDASVGSGEYRDFPDWIEEIKEKLILAGGLDSGNVGRVIKRFKPFGVDVSSGVEKEGRKSYQMMKEFIDEVNNASS